SGAQTWRSGSHNASDSFALSAGDAQAEGIADPLPRSDASLPGSDRSQPGHVSPANPVFITRRIENDIAATVCSGRSTAEPSLPGVAAITTGVPPWGGGAFRNACRKTILGITCIVRLSTRHSVYRPLREPRTSARPQPHSPGSKSLGYVILGPL